MLTNAEVKSSTSVAEGARTQQARTKMRRIGMKYFLIFSLVVIHRRPSSRPVMTSQTRCNRTQTRTEGNAREDVLAGSAQVSTPQRRKNKLLHVALRLIEDHLHWCAHLREHMPAETRSTIDQITTALNREIQLGSTAEINNDHARSLRRLHQQAKCQSQFQRPLAHVCAQSDSS